MNVLLFLLFFRLNMDCFSFVLLLLFIVLVIIIFGFVIKVKNLNGEVKENVFMLLFMIKSFVCSIRKFFLKFLWYFCFFYVMNSNISMIKCFSV